ncbi:MAG: AbrB/MazE/SpoVT family DNA-binding domain-containing protein [Acinetobacter sp.]|jgi:antitoxin VapB|nr:MAG: AbrB/MazE/SpoVT family DNA-binding domain-containing protein [Acinetobacter sp.]
MNIQNIPNSQQSPILSRVFKNGNSQAVRIPTELRLDTDRVQIYKNKQGDLVIHPLHQSRGQAFLSALARFDADFIAHLPDPNEQPDMQEREAL